MSTGKGARYVAIQGVLLLLIAGSGRHAHPTPALQRRVGGLLMLAGTVLGIGSGKVLGRNLTPWPQPVQGGTLVTSGPYAVVRHPIYSALLLLSAGWAMRRGSRQSLGWTAALVALFEFKTRREETELLRQFPTYAKYQRRVRKFVPGVY